MDGPEHPAPLVAGQIFRADGLGGVTSMDDFASIDFFLGDGVNVIPAGLAIGARVPFSGVIDRWALGALKAAGSITVDVYRNTQAQLTVDSPTEGDSMVGAGTKPALASARVSEAAPPSSWSSTTVNADDWLFINVDSAAVLTLVTLELRLRKT